MLLLIASVSIFIASQVHSQDSLCPAGWSFSQNTSYCYIASEQFFTWDESVNYCQSIGAVLVSIKSSREQVFLNELTAGYFAQPWLGIRRNLTNGNFYNLDGTTPFLSYWSTGEPGINGDCVTYKGISPSGMKVTPCYGIQPALCKQMPALCPTQTQYGGAFTRSGVITSPGYPDQYYNNLACPYTITSPVGTYITIAFDPYAVENYFDYIIVFDGNSTSSPYLGEVYNWIYGYKVSSFESSDNSLTFVFVTDSIITDKGWQATWSAKPQTPPIRQSGTNGSFTSPNYPNNYDNYAEQLYYVTVATGFNINMTITDFITEANYDVLEVYNTSTITPSGLVANLSGSAVAPYSYLTPSNYLSLRFKSDGTVQKTGFSLFWLMQ